MPTILVTGAGRGFGRAILDVFAERGWRLFPLVRDPAAAAELGSLYGATCLPIIGDVGNPDVEIRIEEALRHADAPLDLLVNNAGHVKKLRWLPRTDPEDLQGLFRVHCVGAFRCTRAALPYLRLASRPTVVNLTSRWGSIARTVAGKGGGIYSYQIAKCAQNMLSACLDQELRPQGIRVFAVHPGKLKTDSGAVDADTSPRDAAVRLADWISSVSRDEVCGCHDLMGGGLIDW